MNDNADIIDAMFDGTKIVQTINGESPVGGELPIDVGVTSVNGMTGAVTITQRTVKDLIDIIYPVGTYYETTDNTFNPNTAWTGTTWTKITDGRVLIAGGGDYTVGNTYGEKTHKITVSEMPEHNHSASAGSAGAHDHGGHTSTNGDHYHGVRNRDGSGLSGRMAETQNSSGGTNGMNTSTNGDHRHTISQQAAHTHSVTIGKTGSGVAMNMLQPSKAVARWLRTA